MKFFFRFNVNVTGGKLLKVSSSELELVKTAKIVLEEFFANKSGNHMPTHQVSVSRQLLFPETNPTSFNQAEVEDGQSKERSANFAKTANRKLNEEPHNGGLEISEKNAIFLCINQESPNHFDLRSH